MFGVNGLRQPTTIFMVIAKMGLEGQATTMIPDKTIVVAITATAVRDERLIKGFGGSGVWMYVAKRVTGLVREIFV